LFVLAWWVAPQTFVCRCTAGVALQAFVALHIFQLHGLEEMHFFFFTTWVVMIACCDWAAMWPGTVLIIGQHIWFAALTNSGVNVYFFPEPYVETVKLFFHFGIACAFVGVCGYWAEGLRRQILCQEWQRREIARLALVAQRTENAVVLTDAQGRALWVNESFSRLTGRRAEEVEGTVPVSLAPVGLRPGGEVCYPGPDGTERWLAWSVTALEDGPAGPGGYVAIGADVTARKRDEEEHRRWQERAQNAQRLESLGVLAGGIAHDFNNLLGAMLGHASLARDQLPPASAARGPLAEIERAAERAADLTRQVLAYSGKGQTVRGPVDLADCVREMAALLAPTLRRAEVRLEFEDRLPAVEGDPTQLRQVILNLLTNASEALDGAGRITVRIHAVNLAEGELQPAYGLDELPAGRYAVLEVADTGCGMDEATLARAFEPFFTSKFTGRGLGLSAVLGVARSHGGAVSVTSEPGRGSTFRVYLPASDRPAPRPARTPLSLPALGPGGRSVLVIEDEDGIRSVARAALEGAGFSVHTASDGVEGVTAFEAYPDVSVVVLDVTMPRMDGADTLEALRRLRPDLPVILTSGYGEDVLLARFGGRPLAGFLPKPFRPEQLVEAVRSILSVPAGSRAPVGP
jgi:signal transduction histidine kinase/CheY-like chemotaxis protein